MLTKRQLDLLMFIHGRVREDGVSPSFSEMAAGIGLASKGQAHRLLGCLEERGFVRRVDKRARAVEVLKLPAGVLNGLCCPHCNYIAGSRECLAAAQGGN